MTNDRIDLPLWESGASARLINALRNEGCKTLRDAIPLRDQLLRFSNFGKKSLAEFDHLVAGGEPYPSGYETVPRALEAKERRRQAVALRAEGLTLKAIGERLGVRADRVAIYLAKEKRENPQT